jgi:hypothetical protein
MAPTPGTVRRPTELKARPLLDAQTLAMLPAEAAVTIVDRHEGWLHVVAGEQHGWVRLLHVSSEPPGTHGSTQQELERVAQVATGRAGTGNIVVTTGVRGLTEDELRRAQPDYDELERLEALGVDERAAAAYARTHGLERRRVAGAAQEAG